MSHRQAHQQLLMRHICIITSLGLSSEHMKLPAARGEKVDWEGEAAVEGQEEVSHLETDHFHLRPECSSLDKV